MRASDYPYFDQPFIALAHRGGSLLPDNVGRENTLHAFGNAVALGYTHLETDVHSTRDGHLVAFHDDVLDRVTDQRGAIAELSFDEVRQARVGGIDQIPTLDEVLDAFPDSYLNIDIKTGGAVEPLVACLNAHRAQKRVLVGSFGPQRLRQFRRLMGQQVATAVGPIGVGWTAKVPVPGHLVSSPGVAFQMPVDHDVRGHTIKTLTPSLLRSAHASGKVVHIWTVNDADQMEQLIDLGVDGLVTDAIDVLRDLLLARGLWH